MLVCGIDVGSRQIKAVILDSESEKIVEFRKAETTYYPLEQCLKVLEGTTVDRIVSTGYGRKLLSNEFANDNITEILAHALGAWHQFPGCKAVLDIGGQDTKAISLDEKGRVAKFEMNDRCAAGTGKISRIHGEKLPNPDRTLGDFALQGKPSLSINSMCTVFAESEATSLMAKGNDPRDIALALHHSVVKRSLSMLTRVSSTGPLVFSGGVALNDCIRRLIESELRVGRVRSASTRYCRSFGCCNLRVWVLTHVAHGVLSGGTMTTTKTSLTSLSKTSG